MANINSSSKNRKFLQKVSQPWSKLKCSLKKIDVEKHGNLPTLFIITSYLLLTGGPGSSCNSPSQTLRQILKSLVFVAKLLYQKALVWACLVFRCFFGNKKKE